MELKIFMLYLFDITYYNIHLCNIWITKTKVTEDLISQKYLHESRHRHAMNRIRGEGGRFHSGQVKKRK